MPCGFLCKKNESSLTTNNAQKLDDNRRIFRRETVTQSCISESFSSFKKEKEEYILQFFLLGRPTSSRWPLTHLITHFISSKPGARGIGPSLFATRISPVSKTDIRSPGSSTVYRFYDVGVCGVDTV